MRSVDAAGERAVAERDDGARANAAAAGDAARVKVLEARVRELERELRNRDAFVGSVAHELRNPVSPLMLQLERLTLTAAAAPDGQIPHTWLGPQLEAMRARLRRFLTALERILDVTRIDTGRLTLMPEQLDLSEVVREVCAGFARELHASRSELTLRAPTPVEGRWDRVRVEQIVSNLVSNAIRYGCGRPISISVTADDVCARLVVADQGVGIQEADQARIFERFERVAADGSRGGLGIGLWVVRQICTAMGGRIDVDSRLGAGSEFTVTFPLPESRSQS